MKQVEKIYRCVPFWSWNDELDEQGLVDQVEWMNENGGTWHGSVCLR